MTAYPNKGAFGVLSFLCAGEISNSFMHARRILDNEGLKYTAAYEIAEVAYFLVYVSVRSTLFPMFIIRSSFFSKDDSWFTIGCGALIFYQSVGFFGIMIGSLRKKLRNREERISKGVYL